MTEAAKITSQAKSNLAFALRILPKERRDDAVIFYAFCRVIDDLADDLGVPVEQREKGLMEWREGLEEGFPNGDALQLDVLAMQQRRQIPTELLVAIVDGCRMDLRPQRFETWDELSGYTWKVACAVGLIAMRIFGGEVPGCEKYAVALGHALQITNILRDVREDFDNGGRIYLPIEDLRKFGYSEGDLAGKVQDERFFKLMNYEADRAEGFYREAEASLQNVDRKAMVAAEVMREIYQTLLGKMRRDGFRVHEQRYRLSKARKMTIFSKHLMRGAMA
ncbi:phytoene/squalene synthase family protein [Haloferula chungangensis]|uniref:Phytoene/squalene synthase family protein n=1 Tax=Haloferula chungangensis TaxID=1048331 RepID=A0ABW2LE31_9BACT